MSISLGNKWVKSCVKSPVVATHMVPFMSCSSSSHLVVIVGSNHVIPFPLPEFPVVKKTVTLFSPVSDHSDHFVITMMVIVAGIGSEDDSSSDSSSSRKTERSTDSD